VNRFIAFLFLALVTATPTIVLSQQLQALARLDVARSSVKDRVSGDVDILLKLTQAVPYRVFTLAEPARLVMDFREVNFSGVTHAQLIRTDLISTMRYGLFRPGWSRMVLEMAQSMRVQSAVMETDPNDGDALVRIRITKQDGAAFKAASGPTDEDFWALPKSTISGPAKTRPLGDRKVVVALDPGHGGIDPGAQYEGHSEASLMLTFAREMKENLILSGRYEVFLTRNENVFVSLEGRVSRARDDGADVFISLHADALAAGKATGTTIYTLSDTASDKAAAALAASHERSDLLAGVDLSEQDDLIASVLMDMARIETTPRSEKLADALVAGIANSVGKIRSRPRLSAGFSVLKAPDIPSVLIEFGFMSNPSDLANLANPVWRQSVISGVQQALDDWSLNDAAEAKLLRQ